MKKRKTHGTNKQQTLEKKKNLNVCVGSIGEDIIFQEILPRLPVKSIFRFKLVCKKWLNLFTHDPLFPKHHHEKISRPNRNIAASSNFLSYGSRSLFIFNDDHTDQFELQAPRFMTGLRDQVMGSTNGFIYGVCSDSQKIFICNPITNHAVFIHNPKKHLSIAVACDPYDPNFGFTIVSHFIRKKNDDINNSVLQFEVYSSKTSKWRVSRNGSDVPVPSHYYSFLMLQPVFNGGKVFWALKNDILWFDVDKDVGGVIECPDNNNLRPRWNLYVIDIGVCDGDVSFSMITKQEEIEIWLLRDNRNEEFEWVKKHTVNLQRIIAENWNIMSEIYSIVNVGELHEIAKNLAFRGYVKTLPYSGGEVMGFIINITYDKKVLFFNLVTQELKVICVICDYMIKHPFRLYPFVPTLLPCPT
ncbi:hypothetical protein Scep_020227 [Stephania cephalantha]|uniref:F-box domain-containing protein n=1 Tax=Stephania cephalantha TaxID=152367 RepID=A0AAP0ICD1_9MAGN